MESEGITTVDRFTLEDAEELALKLERDFAPLCTKLRDLRPDVEKMRRMFKELCRARAVTIAGCRNFGEFCEKKLGRQRQTVYEMLGDYKQKPKTKKVGSIDHPGYRQLLVDLLAEIERVGDRCPLSLTLMCRTISELLAQRDRPMDLDQVGREAAA